MQRAEFEALLEEELDEVGELMSRPPRRPQSIYRIPGDRIPGYHPPPAPPRPAPPPKSMWQRIRETALALSLDEPNMDARRQGTDTGAEVRKLEEELASSPVQLPETALMEHLAQLAARTRNEAEAEAYIGALLPLAARLTPGAAPVLMGAAPNLITTLAGLTRGLRVHRTTRPMVDAIPTILRNAAREIGRQGAGSRAVDRRTAARALARQTVRVLGSPQQCSRALRTSRILGQAHRRIMRDEPFAADPLQAEGMVGPKLPPRRGPSAAQKELLRQFFGTNVAGARYRMSNFWVPPGMRRRTLRWYELIARRALADPRKATPKAQVLQTLRLQLVARALPLAVPP